ncbi:biotin-independent malonate decarboxylase subunit beta [Terracidiphilus gabretensis]|uniref:biotin-independent malonate decarboxylase subunit beta n=1 Tax=Terracidiphilus gabretensis TaxID=1577687 RepID=UPI00071BEF63|nr:biotin-independent malonate decarboxylase subunit beta [Terracidiphilus gabretensis]
MSASILIPDFVNRKSFIELDARARAQSLFDEGTWKELVGPFDRIESPWLAKQGIAPQFDDGCVVIKGKIGGSPAVTIAFEGAFQGGSVGEVSGAKMTAALDLATKDSKAGKPTAAILLLETGGVRLQEANLGLAAVAEIISSVLALRQHAPVITIVAGTVGCFGGMSLVAGVSSYTIMTREARLGLNGPEVIEQESGIDEFDSSDRALIWAIHGGEQRVGMGLADLLVEDDAGKIAAAVLSCVRKGVPEKHRTEQVELYRARIAALDTSSQIDPATLRQQRANTKGGVR